MRMNEVNRAARTAPEALRRREACTLNEETGTAVEGAPSGRLAEGQTETQVATETSGQSGSDSPRRVKEAGRNE